MVYCKKDAIGGKLSYKGRVDMDKCQIVDLKDGELSHNASAVKNAWKMNNADKDDKWYVLFAKSSAAKEQWMNAFSRERKRVEEDTEKGFKLSPKMKRTAIALSFASSSPIRRRSLSAKKNNVVAVDSSIELNASGSVQNRSRVETVSSISSKGSNYSPGEKKKGKKR